jgi:two-component system LytT family response regulator
MKVRALIIDDEQHAREGIRIRLEEYPAVEIIGECSSGAEAVASVNDLHPDLVFLDIQMPEMNGFEVLNAVEVDPVPMVVFVTAYDKYAIKAFEVHALDYLLKPIGEERFGETLKMVLSQLKHRNLATYALDLRRMVDDYLGFVETGRNSIEAGSSETRAKYVDRIAIKSRGHVSMITVSEVDWIESAGDYVYIHSNSQKHIIRETMTSLEKRIDPGKFVRIHRSTIVNVDRIKSLKSNEHGDFEVHLQNGERLKLSRSYRSHFQEVIGNSF